MSDLDSVIRLHRWRLDEKRRALAELKALADRLTGEASRLEQELQEEQDTARASTEAGYTYGNYAVEVIARRRRLADSLAQVEARILEATEEIAAAFQELKRFELAQEGRMRRDHERRKRAEASRLDEIGLDRFRRRRA